MRQNISIEFHAIYILLALFRNFINDEDETLLILINLLVVRSEYYKTLFYHYNCKNKEIMKRNRFPLGLAIED